jgi:N-acetylglucosamine-6-phosphate deacetylase
MTVIGAARIVSATDTVEQCEVVVDGGVIAEIRPARGAVPDVTLVPGFVDLQVNGIGTVDVAVAAGDDWATLDRALLAQGVTTWCPTLTTAPLRALEEALRRVGNAAGRPAGRRPDIAGAHLEGPFLAVPGAHRPELLRPEVDRAWLDSVAGMARIVTLAPELPGALEAVSALSARGVLVALGHSACDAETAMAAAAAGARLVTHLGNAMGEFRPRAPGLLGAALADERLSVSVIADGVHSHPVFLRTVFAAKSPGSVALVTDAVASSAGTGVPPRLPDGTLAGSVLTMDGALSAVVRHRATGLAGAVESASTTPARLLGLRDRGAIAPGLRADLVALEGGADGWSVASVWVGGEPAWPR